MPKVKVKQVVGRRVSGFDDVAGAIKEGFDIVFMTRVFYNSINDGVHASGLIYCWLFTDKAEITNLLRSLCGKDVEGKLQKAQIPGTSSIRYRAPLMEHTKEISNELQNSGATAFYLQARATELIKFIETNFGAIEFHKDPILNDYK